MKREQWVHGVCIATILVALGLQIARAQSDNEVVAAGGGDQQTADKLIKVEGDAIDGGQLAWGVSPDGAFTYSIPVAAPQGRRGVQPKLRLAYSSSGSNDIAGVGWSLRGLPAIVRFSFDRGIQFDGSDVYALADSPAVDTTSAETRLIQTAPGTYHTYREGWTEFRAHGTCGDGPCSWTMRDGTGLTYTFGQTSAERLANRNDPSTNPGILVWALSSVEDLHGNAYTVTYIADDWMLYPDLVRYGCLPQDPCSGVREIDLQYEYRSDATAAPARYSKRLSAIVVRSAGKRVRTYDLVYGTSPASDRSRLASVNEVGTTSAQRNVATFTYYDNPIGTSAVAGFGTERHLSTNLVDTLTGADTVACDVNADGFDDVIRVAQGPSGRYVDYALGSQAGLGAWHSAISQPGNDTRVWHTQIGDVDGDSHCDLVLWGLSGRVNPRWASVRYALGTGQGLSSTLTEYHANLVDIVKDGDSTADFRLLVSDVDGDQRGDVLLMNRHDGSLVSVSGITDATPQTQVFHNSPSITARTARLEPLVTDLNGDGFGDIVVTYSDKRNDQAQSGLGVVSTYYLGGRSGLTSPHSINWNLGWTGRSPYQALADDLNGDGKADLTIAYTGEAVFNELSPGQQASGTTPWDRPFFRDVRSLLSQSGVHPFTSGVPLNQVTTNRTPSYPHTRTRYHAFWQHRSLDYNCDGLADVAMLYAGENGRALHFAAADENGDLGVAVPYSGFTSATPEPDGEQWINKTMTIVSDVNKDGCDDLLVGYSGGSGIFLEVVFGGKSGPSDALLFGTLGVAPDGTGDTDMAPVLSVDLLTPDINGDGYPDPMLANMDSVRFVLSHNATRDRMRRVTGGYGAEVEVRYEPAAHHIGAMTDLGSQCGHLAGPEEGYSQVDARLLATSVRIYGGRSVTNDSRYYYRNGRIRRGMPEVRDDLGFEQVSAVNQLTGVDTCTTYRQDGDYRRSPARVQTLLGPKLISDEEYVYDTNPNTRFSTVAVQLERRMQTTWESGHIDLETIEHYDYTDYGAVGESTLCRGNDCITTTTTFEPADLARWITTRISGNRVGRPKLGLVLDWRKVHYQNDLIDRVERLLCDDASLCVCYEDGDQCVASGVGRWVDTEYDRLYDAFGNLREVRDARGNLTVFTYDSLFNTHRATKNQTVSNGGITPVTLVEATFYNDLGRIERSVDVNGQAIVYRYDAFGRPRRTEYPDGGWERWTYSAIGSPTSQKVRHEIFVKEHKPFEHLCQGDDLVPGSGEEDGPLRAPCDPKVDPNCDECDPDDVTSSCWSFAKERFPDGRIASTTAGSTTRVSPTADRSICDMVQSITLWDDTFFDGVGRVYKHERQASGSDSVVREWEQTYRNQQLVRLASLRHFASASPGHVLWTEVTYDERTRPTDVRRKLGASLTAPGVNYGLLRKYRYDARKREVINNAAEIDYSGRLVGADTWQTTELHYDTRGLLDYQVDPSGNETHYSYDTALRLDGIIGPSVPQGAIPKTPWVQSVQHYFDSWGRIQRTEDTALGETTFDYDDVGNLVDRVDGQGHHVHHVYDEIGRLLRRERWDVPSQPTLDSYRYDETTTVNGLGRMTSMTNPVNAVTMIAYDAMGRDLGREVTIDGLPGSYRETYQYDVQGHLVAVTLPNNRVVSYHHGVYDGLLKFVTSAGINIQIPEYDAFDQPTKRYLGAATVHSYYRPDGLPDQIVATKAGSIIQDVYYQTFDAQHNLLRVDDAHHQETWDYQYDDNNQLTFATLSRPGSAGVVRQFSYDAAGNILQQGTTQISYPDPRTIVSSTSYPALFPLNGALTWHHSWWVAQFDDVGNMVAKGQGIQTIYRYDQDNRLTSVGGIFGVRSTFSYGGKGERVRKTEYPINAAYHVSTYYVSPNYELRESSQNPGVTVATSYIRTPEGKLLATVTDDQLGVAPTPAAIAGAVGSPMTGTTIGGVPMGVQYILSDYLDSTSAVLDAAGNVLSEYAYGPFGVLDRTRSRGYDQVTSTYTGQQADAATGLLFYGARYYDPSMGRFITADTETPGEGIQPQGLNRYAYVFNNPLRYTDPTGHAPQSKADGGSDVAKASTPAKSEGVGGLDMFFWTWDTVDWSMSPTSATSIGSVVAGTVSIMAKASGHDDVADAASVAGDGFDLAAGLMSAAGAYTLAAKLYIKSFANWWEASGKLRKARQRSDYTNGMGYVDYTTLSKSRVKSLCEGGNKAACYNYVTRPGARASDLKFRDDQVDTTQKEQQQELDVDIDTEFVGPPAEDTDKTP